jgi:uncharacterized Zn-finger protein
MVHRLDGQGRVGKCDARGWEDITDIEKKVEYVKLAEPESNIWTTNLPCICSRNEDRQSHPRVFVVQRAPSVVRLRLRL